MIEPTNLYQIFKIFINRGDCYALMKEGLNEYTVINGFLTSDNLAKHIDGSKTVGIFQLSKDNKVKWICWDFDSENGNLEKVLENAKKLYIYLKNYGYHPLLEFSGRRGYHVWIFCERVEAESAKNFAERMSRESGSNPHEIFPKQTYLNGKGYGSMVKLPLGVHRVSNKKSFFYDDSFNELTTEESLELLKSQKIDVIPKDSTTALSEILA